MKILNLLCFVCCVFAFGQKFTKEELSLINQGNLSTALPIFQTTDEHQHSVLLKNSMAVNPKDKATEVLVNRMKLSLLATDGGVGIAAPQVGINRNVIWVQRFDKLGEPLEYFLNPKIIWKSEILNKGPEGDLSIPDFRDLFYRSQVIQLDYFDLKGQKHTELVEGFTAVIFQHEIDHLSGILISDKNKNETDSNIEKVDAYKRMK